MRIPSVLSLVAFLPGVLSIHSGGAHAEDAGKVRKVEVRKDQVVRVRTAPTIATIIQVPDRPNSIVLGNQSAFQVEYLDTAVTVKSLTPNARGNLYIYTDYRRYNIDLVTGSGESADYIVDLADVKLKAFPERPDPKPTVRWKAHRSSATGDGLRLEIERLGVRSDGYLLVEFILKAKQGLKVDPGWFWITQNGVIRPIHHLFLGSLNIPRSGKVSGTIVMLKDDIRDGELIRIEVRKGKVLALALPKLSLWKEGRQ